MMLATLESGGIDGILQLPPDGGPSCTVVRHLELDHQHLALGEDVGLAGRRNADDAGDRVRGLELRRDDEVDVELPSPPDLEVLDVGRAHDRLRRGDLLREHGGDEIDLVPRRRRDDEVGVGHTRIGENAPARGVPGERHHVEAIGERREPGAVLVDDGHGVLEVQRLDDRGPDLAGSEDDDLHGGGLLQASRAAASP